MKAFKIINLLTISYLGNLSTLNAQVKDGEALQIKANEEQTAKQDKQITGTVYFINGDSISGEITNWDLKLISISSPDLIEPLTFKTSYISNIILDDQLSTEEANEFSDLTSLIIQHRGNQKGLHGVIKGGFSNIDDSHVTLNTSYAGKVKVLKKFVTKMEIDSKKGYLYLGPQSLNEWHSNNTRPQWQYTNQSLISGNATGNIAKDINIPETAVVSFDLSWKKDEELILYLYSSDHEQSRPDDYYKLELKANNRVTMNKYMSGKRHSDITSKREKERRAHIGIQRNIIKDALNAHYDIYVSKAQGVFHIFRNGDLVDTITDTNPKPNNFGSAIHLISSNNSPVRIKNLSLAKWSGNLPSDIDHETFAELKGEGQRILLKNGDIFLGKVGSVKNGMIKIETLHTPINLPVVRMRSIDLTTDNKKDEPLMYEADIKCWFKNEDWIILKPISVNGNKLTAYHQALGENEFDINAFKRIDFNIYSHNTTQAPSPDDW